mgnify:CR=1 FL=1
MSTPAFTHLAEVGSTNDWLLARAETLPDGHWVIADRQTAGRGRRGRAWSDGTGNFMGSVLVKAAGPVQQLSFVAALALHGALAGLSGQPARFALKWPNDLLLDGIKCAGILLERQGSAVGDALVIGIGVNLAHHPDGTERPATSLAAAGLPVPPPVGLLDKLAPAFAHWCAMWARDGFAPIREAWLERSTGLGTRIVARLGAESPEGLFEGLAEDGALLMRLDDGTMRAIHAGEVFAV